MRSCVRENDGCRDSRVRVSRVIAARWCATRKVRGEDRERPYRVESWVVGARACLPSARNARGRARPWSRQLGGVLGGGAT